MTRKRVDLVLHKQGPIPGRTCSVAMHMGAPEDRGHVGRVHIRVDDENGNLREVWWLRCPWCRELLELEPQHLHMRAARLEYGRPIQCGTCHSEYEIHEGQAAKLAPQGPGELS